MNAAFRGAVAQFKTPKPVLTHGQRVCRLYRHSLKLLGSWSVFRELFVVEAEKIRAEFDANKDMDPNSKKASVLLEKGEAKLYDYTHPDPYVCAYMPGGSLYMRNPSMPRCVVYNFDVPDGLPEEKFMNPDMTPARDDQYGNVGQVFVDYASKQMH